MSSESTEQQDGNEFDVALLGGGPAGLSAGIISAYKGLRTVVFEGGTWGGLLSTIYPYKGMFFHFFTRGSEIVSPQAVIIFPISFSSYAAFIR